MMSNLSLSLFIYTSTSIYLPTSNTLSTFSTLHLLLHKSKNVLFSHFTETDSANFHRDESVFSV